MGSGTAGTPTGPHGIPAFVKQAFSHWAIVLGSPYSFQITGSDHCSFSVIEKESHFLLLLHSLWNGKSSELFLLLWSLKMDTDSLGKSYVFSKHNTMIPLQWGCKQGIYSLWQKPKVQRSNRSKNTGRHFFQVLPRHMCKY